MGIMTAGQRMKEKRKELGLSAEFIADKLGVSPATIYRYEKGDIEKIPGNILEQISKILKTTPAYLMGWEEMMRVGMEISRRRKALNMSQEELAKACGFKSRSSINKIELGQRGLPLRKVELIADALKTTPAELMGW